MILKTAEDEVKIIQMVFDRYIHTNDGINGVANNLNNHGALCKKIDCLKEMGKL